MLGTHSLALFATTVFVVNATPGVDMMLTLTRTLRYGVRGGLAAALGVMAGCVVHAQAPNWFTTAPVGAIQKVLKSAGWMSQDVELWEVNEAFAAVTMAAMHEFDLPAGIVNVHGGAVALGHPIGASGARIVVTLIGALRQAGKKKGVAALCIGGGEATAIAVELF